jgi:ribosomal protein L40E
MATEILDVVRSEMAEMMICERCGALLPTHYALRLCFDCRQEELPTTMTRKGYWRGTRERLR